MGSPGGPSSATLVIPGRFNGPAGSANGGYAAGVLAETSSIHGPVQVDLRRPPPLDTELEVANAVDGVQLRQRHDVIASAVPAQGSEWSPGRAVPVETAQALEKSYVGFGSHPFPRCFSCGPDREPGDGLRIFPGKLDEDRVAASWTPHESCADADGQVTVPVTWAALDCVSAWSSDLDERPMVLARMAARVESRPQAGTPYAVVGTLRRTEGRKTWTASHLYDAEGQLVGQAAHLWIAVPRETVRALQG